jgi:hypothetical protein
MRIKSLVLVTREPQIIIMNRRTPTLVIEPRLNVYAVSTPRLVPLA